MKRMKVLFGQRRIMVLATLAILVLTAAALVASSASFTAQKANPGNFFSAGNLNITSIPAGGSDGGIILTASDIIPGYSDSSVVHVSNTGNVAGHFTLETALSSTTTPWLSDRLTLTIQEVADITGAPLSPVPAAVYSGPMNNIATEDLLNWNGGVNHFYEFTVTWDNTNSPAQDATDNLYKGSDVTAVFTWKATQL